MTVDALEKLPVRHSVGGITTRRSWPRLSTVLWKSLKKKSLSLMIGPPRVAPNCWYFVSGFFAVADAKKFLAWVDSLLPKKNALPRSWLVPDFRTTTVTDPPARPNSASKLEVDTLTESIDSADGISTVSRPVLWLSSSPSTCTLFERRDWPLNFVSWLSCGLKNWECGRVSVTVPGTVAHMPWKLRP